MGKYITKYQKGADGKIRKDKAGTKAANKNGAAGSKPAADNKNNKPDAPAKG